jgi:Sulfatase
MIDHDNHVGQLLDLLDKLGIADDTIVMYGTDNGPHMNTWPDAAMTPFRSEKNTNWEGAFRVPMMVRWPGRFPAGVVSNEIVQHHDWLPTFLAAAGEPDVVEKLKQGQEAAAKTFRVHIDGYNLLPYPHRRGGEEPAARVHLLQRRRRPGRLALRQLEGRLHGAEESGDPGALGRAVHDAARTEVLQSADGPVRACRHDVEYVLGLVLEQYAAAADVYLHGGTDPTLARPLAACGYGPMRELLAFLEEKGFTSYIAGGDRDFMRPFTQEMYGIPPERVIGSSNGLRYQEDEHGGTVVYLAEPDVFDDGPVKPVRIWSRIGQRPVLAVGNSNGDVEMLRSPAVRRVPGCASSSSTTTPSASSTTRPVRSARWSRPGSRTGRSSASRTTGRGCLPRRRQSPALGVAFVRRSATVAVRCWRPRPWGE